ncbi:hypothetical protein E1B28_001717 [Marasmius oreades]|uniref:Cytochrome P450 n=1 Tax=Marasmius oreades TaxID=181124 RepID=A0A9P7V4C4_9AGAR|nr:uncharacterized protein E1B28_001717 [Marasmius oreades]KAG7099922.1 hypothetical protein E1B28_001717 [Marasmius oreades]
MIIFILSFFTLVAFFYFRHRKATASLPPGPTPLPFIGNLHQLPPVEPYKTYASWTERYGPIIYMHLFGREFIVLNQLEDVLNLFEKRSSLYSTKPRLVMAGELVGRERTSMLFLKYGPMMQKTRQIVHSWMNPKASKNAYALQELGSLRTILRILETPDRYAQHIRITVGSVILKLTYGIDTEPENDPWIQLSESLSHITAEASKPGRWLVDSFPSMVYIPSWFPGASWKKWGSDSRTVSMNLVRLPYQRVKDKLAEGSQDVSWTASQLAAFGENPTPSEEDALICAAGSLYAGGIDTTTIVIRTFILMMVRYPEIQRRAQEDIDRVVGTHRLPNMGDMDSLPYISYIIKETLRINPLAPVIPHSLDKDDVYKGYRIPKGTWIMANAWAIHHDPTVHKDPDVFNPSRFETTNGNIPERDPSILAFGFGRRICPGMHLSQASMFLYIAHLLFVYEMSPVPDKDGNCIPPPAAYYATHLRYPEHFPCKFTPRSQERVKLVEDAVANGTHALGP